VLDLLEKASHSLNTVLLWVGAGLLVLTMIEAVANMVLRPLAHPIQGSFELMGFASAVIAAFGLSHCQEVKSHISVDILFKALPADLKAFLEALGNGACSLFFSIAGYRVFLLALSLWRSGEVSETLRIPFYPFTACVSLGLFALSLTLLVDVMRDISRFLRG